MDRQEAIKKILLEGQKRGQNEQLGILDALRKVRISRGGVGAPLEIPRHLTEVRQTIFVTDADDVKSRTRSIAD